MNDVVKPKKSDPYDPKPVIKYAAQQAVKTGRDHYVVVKTARFVCDTQQPSPTWSHWKVDHMGELYAHIGGMSMGITEYHYEKAGQ